MTNQQWQWIKANDPILAQLCKDIAKYFGQPASFKLEVK